MAKDKFVAVAYTDVNGDHKFHPIKDVLIAGVLDTNRDGTVSLGDTLTWGDYPTQIDGQGTFGTFGGADYIVVGVGEGFPPESVGVTVQTGSTTFGFVNFTSTVSGESFSTFSSGSGLATFSDNFSTVSGQDQVSVQVTANNLPGLQDTPANDLAFHPGNDGFLDVFIA